MSKLLTKEDVVSDWKSQVCSCCGRFAVMPGGLFNEQAIVCWQQWQEMEDEMRIALLSEVSE